MWRKGGKDQHVWYPPPASQLDQFYARRLDEQGGGLGGPQPLRQNTLHCKITLFDVRG